MNAFVTGHFHLHYLKGFHLMPLGACSRSLATRENMVYNRVLTFGDMCIYISSDASISTRHVQTARKELCVEQYIMKDVDLIETGSGKLALVPKTTERVLAETGNGEQALIPKDNESVNTIFIGNTISTKAFNATLSGEIEPGERNACVFEEGLPSNLRSYRKIIYSKHHRLKLYQNNPEKTPVRIPYHIVIAILRYNSVIRHKNIDNSGRSLLYTFNFSEEIVSVLADSKEADAIEKFESCVQDGFFNDSPGEPGSGDIIADIMKSKRWKKM